MTSTDLPSWAADLDLRPHPEGGWYAETYRHSAGTETARGRRSLATAIHFLLLPGESSAWHRVASDELWFHHRGGALRLWVAAPGPGPADPVERLLGPDVAAGERPQLLVGAGHWQAARPVDEAVLVSCVVVTGFDFADFELASELPLP
jgi:predicted cupin superfamily sugar epimerase